MKIVQVNTAATGGGAERIALDLHVGYLRRGYDAELWVGREPPEAMPTPPGVHTFDPDLGRGHLADAVMRRSKRRPDSGTGRALRAVAGPGRAARLLLGHEDFDFPGSRAVLAAADRADVAQLHNLHGRFFDLRLLPEITRRAATILTMHDAWLISGHCAHSFGCDRWMTGCGECPSLATYPSVRRDATAYNWQRKASIYHDSRVHVATPSRWLLERVERSVLAPAIVGARVIPNGVDTSVFKPTDPLAARQRLGLPADDLIVLYAAGRLDNPFKDWPTLRRAVQSLPPQQPPLRLVVLGDAATGHRPGLSAEIDFRGAVQDSRVMADYYAAADVYAHAARADTFPTAVLEALASGTPVVASAVGGIPEQVDYTVTGHLA